MSDKVLVVKSVNNDSQAALAGMSRGDLIMSFNGVIVTSDSHFGKLLLEARQESLADAPLIYKRGKNLHKLMVKLDQPLGVLTEDVTKEAVENFNPETDFCRKLMRRYDSAYAIASDMISQGSIQKFMAFLAGGAVLLGFLYLFSTFHQSGMGVVIGLIAAFVVGKPLYALGVMIEGQGQTLAATLDTAVNTSRHLNNDQVREVLNKL